MVLTISTWEISWDEELYHRLIFAAERTCLQMADELARFFGIAAEVTCSPRGRGCGSGAGA